MLDLDTARRAIHRDISAARSTLSALDAGRWDAPTELTSWTVRHLALHLFWGQALQAAAWERLRRGDTDVFVPPETDSVDPPVLVAELESAHTAFMDALDAVEEDTIDAACPMPYGALPGRFVLQVAAMEAGIHRFDLDRALGAARGLSTDTVQAASTVLAGVLPTLGSAGESPNEPTNVHLRGERFTVDLGWSDGQWQSAEIDGTNIMFSGSDEALVLFALGRLDAAEADVLIQGSEDSGAFKRWFPGP
jgi:uncharacterized protein (TIGR03083 family)